MNPNNRFFSWVGVASGVLGIVGFLMQIGATPVLAPLVAMVKLPVWLLLCVVLALPYAISVAFKHAVAGLLTSSDQAADRVAQLEAQGRLLDSELQAIPMLQAEANQGKKHSAKLAEYESLEREILGASKNGNPHSLLELGLRTSAGQTSTGEQRLLRATASLDNRIVGSSGKYRLAAETDALP